VFGIMAFVTLLDTEKKMIIVRYFKKEKMAQEYVEEHENSDTMYMISDTLKMDIKIRGKL
jgi:hypothetical protein